MFAKRSDSLRMRQGFGNISVFLYVFSFFDSAQSTENKGFFILYPTFFILHFTTITNLCCFSQFVCIGYPAQIPS